MSLITEYERILTELLAFISFTPTEQDFLISDNK